MRAVLRLAGHELRARWLSWVALALLVGLAGGVVLTAAAGARRTDSAYPRYLAAYQASDVLVAPAEGGIPGLFGDALARLPDVAAIAPIVGLQALPVGPRGQLNAAATVAAPLDRRFGHTLEVPKMLAGRQPNPNRPGEVMIDQIAAQDLHVRVGSRLKMGAVAGSDLAHIRWLSERVVGVMVDRGSVVPVNDIDKAPTIIASQALFRELGPRYLAFDGAYLKLRPGATVGDFSNRVQALAHKYQATTGGQIFVADEAVQADTVERSIRPQAVALGLFALVLAVTALLVVGQVGSRQLLAASRDNVALAALGMTRGQLLATGLIEVAVAVAAGAALGCGLAITASPLMPIGPARLAEPDPGLSVDVPVLTVGFAAIVILLLGRVAWPAWRLASARHAAERDAAGVPGRRSQAAERLARAGAPVPAVTGVRFAFDPGQGRTAVPVRSALLGLVLSVAAVTAAATFGANLLHLVHTPRLYGQTWDAEVDLGFGVITPQQFARLTAHVPGLSGWTYGVHGTVQVGNVVIPAIGLAPGRGPLAVPTLLEGRPPGSRHEIVLGTSTLRLTGTRVGQAVPVTVGGRRAEPAKIVGRAIFPYFGQGSFTPTDLGQGAAVTAAALTPQSTAASGGGYNFILLTFAPGPRQAADMAAFTRAMTPYCAMVQQPTCLITDQRPNGASNYARIDATPEVLAGILALLGLAVLGQFAVASARRRRRDFAILRTLGLLRRQLAAITAWQVTTLTALALLVGLPLGVAVGHWAWALFADEVGLSTAAITPMTLVLLTIPGAILAAIAVTLPAGRRCARLRPAAVLRSE
jgi:FtsX-like permease family/MacB-like periplasmic core domain